MPEAFNFLDKLFEARRRAQLSGRPLTSRETSGIVSGVAETASERLARARGISLEEQRLAQQKELEQQRINEEQKRTRLLEKQQKQSKTESTIGSVAGGAAIGWAVGGPIGAGIGAIGGFVLDKLCIIITACYGKDSYQVEIARKFRDRYLDETTLAGYYTLCYWIVPQMVKSRRFSRFIKKWLVDRLVDYGAVKLGYFGHRWYKTSLPVTKGFLALCKVVGKANELILRSSKYGKSTNRCC